MDHLPVLKNEIVRQFDYLKNIRDVFFVDGTLGAGGHSLAIAQSLLHLVGERANTYEVIPRFKIIGIDKDNQALKLAKENIKKAGLIDNFIFIHDDFKNINKILADLKVEKISGALLDLGISSMQLDRPERGFTFLDQSAPLDMRMNQDQNFSADDIINNFPQDKIEKILREIGEERYAKAIARNIAKFRKAKEIKTVGELLTIVKLSMPPKYIHVRGKHFATNTFRALRIEVNGELNNLDKAIRDYVKLLETGARMAIVTFHSSEDRIVKNTFRELEKPCLCPPKAPVCSCGRLSQIQTITKKPVVPTESEIENNPRSRSAKLRIIERI